MVSAIDKALRTRDHLLVQAGTGTGKSLAYLVPALASGKRVVVATATKALQAQLVDKDLPRLVAALAKQLGRTPTYALAKGRGNYVCLQQLHGGPGAREEPEQSELFSSGPSALAQQVLELRRWAAESETGDRDEVPFPVNDATWRQISVSARECLGTRCPDRVDCFSEKAREATKEADIVVANHTLLALHVLSDAAVLPDHEAIILDEAHEFVASATDALTHELSTSSIRRASLGATLWLSEPVRARLDDAQDALEGVLATTELGWVRTLPDYALDVLLLVEGAVAAAVREVSGAVEDEVEKAQQDRAKQGLLEVGIAASELRVPTVASAIYASPSGGQGSPLVLRISPLSVGGTLATRLFGETTVIATSATLTLGGSFRHVSGQLGLAWLAGRPIDETSGADATADHPEARDPAAVAEVLVREEPPSPWRSIDVGSPFDHAKQGQLWVASTLPDPSRSPSDWAAAVDEVLIELITAAGGRTLALFSSTAAVLRAATAVRAALDFPILVQGEDSPGALQHAFAADARTCLFGTRSFWQGIDTPGSTCQLVVIDRIPFPHLNDPLQKARLAAAGPAGFATVTLPPAAVLLAQGAGRLLRSDTDKGVIAVLDPRLSTATYSATLHRTLPDFYRAQSKEAVLASLRAIDVSAAPIRDPGPPPSVRRANARAAARAAL